MTIARAFRLLLAFAAALVVGWSFFDVGTRLYREYNPGDGRVHLTVMHWGDPAEDQIVQKLCADFEQLHPDIKIDRINPGTSEFQSKLRTMCAAGTPPDVFYLDAGQLADMNGGNLIRPIDDYVEREKRSGKAAWLKDIYPLILDAYRYDAQTQRVGSGPLYGLPKDFTTLVFYVNVDLFDQAGVKIPYGGWTWDEFEADMKKITALTGKPGFERRKIYGGFFNLWPATLREILWTYGGDFFGPGGFRDVALGSPASQAALQMICRVRQRDQTVYNPTGVAKDGGQEFLNGNIGCMGPVGRWYVPQYKDVTTFRWDCVPVPYQQKRFQSSQVFTTAWSMSSATKHPDQSFELIKFLCSPEGAIDQARQGLAIPPLKSVAVSDDFLRPPGLPPHNAQVFLDAIAYARLQQSPREAEWLQIVQTNMDNCISLGDVKPAQMAADVKRRWLTELDSPLRRQAWGPMRWNLILTVTAAAVVTAVAALVWRARREKLGAIDRAQERAGAMFIMPWLVGFVALTVGPMIVSLLLGFTRWSAMLPMSTAQSVGLANYHQLLVADPSFYTSLKVTVYFVLLAVPIGQVAALAVALLMNSKVRGIGFFRTVYFVPSVVSGVALSVLWLQIFNKDYGLLNKVLAPVLRVVHLTPPDWFGTDGARWAIPAFVIMGLWGVGGGMIIYLAGLKGIPVSLYEAATIDGAGPARRFWNVTLPMLSPLLFYNLVMGIIGSFQVFTQAKMMTNGGPKDATLLYVLYLYRQAFDFHNMGYASALAWVLFVIILVLTILIFRGSKGLVYYEGLKA